MPALAEVPPDYPGSRQVFRRKRHRLDQGVLKKHVKFMACLSTATALNSNRRFQDIRDRYTARCFSQDPRLLSSRIVVPVQECRQGRRINDYPGRPLSS